MCWDLKTKRKEICCLILACTNDKDVIKTGVLTVMLGSSALPPLDNSEGNPGLYT